MDYNGLVETLDATPLSRSVHAHSLYAAFEQVSDGRKRRGKHYPLALLLTLMVLAKLAGETTLSGCAQWLHLRKEQIGQQVSLKRDRLPCANTYTYALAHVDAEEVTRVVQQMFTRLQAEQRCGSEPSRLLADAGREEHRHVALDGKTLRGTLKHEPAEQAAVHLLSLYEVSTGIVLAQRQVSSKEFEDPEADRSDWRSQTVWDKGHGRIEKRTVTTSSQMKDFFARDWPGIEQVFRIERVVTRKGVSHTEIVYGFTSLSPKSAGPAQIGQFVRAHWAIENRLHRRRDVTLAEDACQVRTGKAPQVLAALNNTVLALMDHLKVRNVAAQQRIFDAQPHKALAFLLGSTFEKPWGEPPRSGGKEARPTRFVRPSDHHTTLTGPGPSWSCKRVDISRSRSRFAA